MRRKSRFETLRFDLSSWGQIRKTAVAGALATSLVALSALPVTLDSGMRGAFGSAMASEPQQASDTVIPVKKPETETAEAKKEDGEPVAEKPRKKRFSFGRFFKSTDAVEEKKADETPVVAVKKKTKADNSEVAQLVRHYEAYRADLKSISTASVNSEKRVQEAYERLASYDEVKLSRAWVAYNGSVAANTPEFSSEVARRSKRKGTARFLNSLHKDADNVLRLGTSGRAAQSVINNVTAETAAMREMGATFKKVSVDLQLAKALSSSPAVAKATTAQFINTGAQGSLTLASGSPKLKFTNPSLDPKARPMLSKMLILGAHISTNKTNGKHSKQTVRVTKNDPGLQPLVISRSWPIAPAAMDLMKWRIAGAL
jgi:hypothetical protein